jgi:hypothetical protein
MTTPDETWDKSDPQAKDRFLKTAAQRTTEALAKLIGQKLGKNVTSAELVNGEFKHFFDKHADVVIKVFLDNDLDNPHLIHLEYQTTNKPLYYCNMGIYRFLLILNTEITSISSVVVYCGSSPCQLELMLNSDGLTIDCHLIDLTDFDLEEILTNESIYVRLFAIFNQSLPKVELAERLAAAIVDYCAHNDDMSGTNIVSLFKSLCTKKERPFYMDVRAFINQMGLPIGDIRESIAYEDEILEAKAEGKVETKIELGLSFLQETSYTLPEIIQILKMDEQTAEMFRTKAAATGFDVSK